jgi:hypothetical protein
MCQRWSWEQRSPGAWRSAMCQKNAILTINPFFVTILTYLPWKAEKLLISGDFEDPLREQPPWNQDQNRTPPVQSNSRTTQDSKTETNRIHLEKSTKTRQLNLRFTTPHFWIQVLWRGDDSPKRRQSPNNTSHPRRPQSSRTLLWAVQILHVAVECNRTFKVSFRQHGDNKAMGLP